jgi:hypothetical protein
VAEMRRERRGASVPRFFYGRSSPPCATAGVMKQTVKTLNAIASATNGRAPRVMSPCKTDRSLDGPESD